MSVWLGLDLDGNRFGNRGELENIHQDYVITKPGDQWRECGNSRAIARFLTDPNGRRVFLQSATLCAILIFLAFVNLDRLTESFEIQNILKLAVIIEAELPFAR